MGDTYIDRKDNATVWCENGDWIQVPQDRDYLWAVVNTVMNLHVP
jgi:hypothetical protein